MNILSLRSYNHCKERYKQRFNDDLSENDFEDIIKLVQNHNILSEEIFMEMDYF